MKRLVPQLGLSSYKEPPLLEPSSTLLQLKANVYFVMTEYDMSLECVSDGATWVSKSLYEIRFENL